MVVESRHVRTLRADRRAAQSVLNLVNSRLAHEMFVKWALECARLIMSTF